MKEFKRFDNTITVKIGEAEFVGDPVILEATNGMATKAVEGLNTKMNSGEATPEVIENTIKELIALVEKLFGEGSILKILGTNTVSFHDMCDIFVYLKKAAYEFEQRKAVFYQSYDLNREERRAKANEYINRQTGKHNKPRR